MTDSRRLCMSKPWKHDTYSSVMFEDRNQALSCQTGPRRLVIVKKNSVSWSRLECLRHCTFSICSSFPFGLLFHGLSQSRYLNTHILLVSLCTLTSGLTLSHYTSDLWFLVGRCTWLFSDFDVSDVSKLQGWTSVPRPRRLTITPLKEGFAHCAQTPLYLTR